VRFSILGPLEVWTDGEWVSAGAPKWRTVLASLLLRQCEIVPTTCLVDELWPRDPPHGAWKLVSLYVMRVRRVLGDCDGRLLVTRSSGYQLLVKPDDVDARLFDDLKCRGRQALAERRGAHASALFTKALALWRGQPLCDVPRTPFISAAANQLEESRLEAVELHCESDLACGRHGELVAELKRLVAEYPLRESFRAQLMLALYRSGRQYESLASYQQAHHFLVDQAGLEPGPELKRLHQRILCCDPELMSSGPPAHPAPPRRTPRCSAERRSAPRSPLPRQLPPATACFTGRSAELAALSRMMGQVTPGAVRIVAVDGTAGVGKTALVVRWAHQVADAFPDGQLYVDLRGFDVTGSPLSPVEAIRGILDAFFVPAQHVPAQAWAQSALYRSLTSGRRMLVLLDNARDSEQVRQLLPGFPGCMVVATSRIQLTDLVAAEGASHLTLDQLTVAEARALLVRRLGAERCAADPAAVTELIHRCARLPLALSIASAQAICQPHLPLSVLAARLRDVRHLLDALSADQQGSDVRAVFCGSYRQLSDPGARMFRLLGVHPGPDISTRAAASLAGLPLQEARNVLAELTRAHLLAQHRLDRFAFHHLLRSYALDQARTPDGRADRRAALPRVLDHYLHTARAAAALLDPGRDPLTLPDPRAGVVPERLADGAQALNWLEAEHTVLLAVLDLAARSGFDRHAQQIRAILAGYGNGREMPAAARLTVIRDKAQS
jgi:DNA-binding SARP family transcriptional activator